MGKEVIKGRGLPGKESENYTLYSDGTILLRGVRGSYVHMDKPYVGKDQKAKGAAGKYSIVALLPKDTHDKAKRLVEGQIKALLDERNKGADIKADAKFLRDGDLAGKPEYKGMWTINASESRPPILRGFNNEKIDREHMGERKIADLFQSGFWFDILISPWWQDNDYGKKANCNILAVKAAKRDEIFGEGGITEDDVDDAFGSSDDDAGFGSEEDL